MENFTNRIWTPWPQCRRGVCGEWKTEYSRPAYSVKELRAKVSALTREVEALEDYKRSCENVVRERSHPKNQWFWYDVISLVLVPELSKKILELKKLQRMIPQKWTEVSPNGRITDEMIQRAKQHPLTDFIELKRGSFTWCPFHDERSPSFKVDTERNRWHCFGACGEGGDVISFIMKDKGLSFVQSVKFLCQ